jgi:hypothetical protein
MSTLPCGMILGMSFVLTDEMWVLVVTDHDNYGSGEYVWAEGPLPMLDAMRRRALLWDSEPGRCSIETYLHRNTEEKS